MGKMMKKMIASAVAVAMAFSIPVVNSVSHKEVKAAEWNLVWSDEFNGTALDRNNWNVEQNGNGGGNQELQYYLDNTKNIEVSNGSLKIHALHESYGGKQYTSGRITTENKRKFLYGKIEARIKLPRFSGAWPAFWMLGNNINKGVGWPKCGEMDIMEAINNDNNVYSNLHWDYQGGQADTKGSAHDVGDRTQYHVYGMEWDANRAKFYVDDTVIETYNITDGAEMQEFRKEQFIILNLAIGGTWPGNNIDNSAFPDRSTMEVDWVRVYQKPPEPTTAPPVTSYVGESDVDMLANANGKFSTYQCGANGWAGTAVINSDTTQKNGATVNISSIGNSIWALQAHSQKVKAIAGNTYRMAMTLTSTINKQIRIKIRGNDSDEYIFFDETINLQANQPYELVRNVTIPSTFNEEGNYIVIDYGFGKNENENLPENTAFNLAISNASMVTRVKEYVIVTTKGSPTTKSSTTNAPETVTDKSGAVVTKKDGTPATPQEYTLSVSKVKVTKATKKKSAKKVTLKIKKITGVTGYQVAVYKSKKNAKKNKKAILKKFTKKNKAKFTVSGKKLKGKKKLFVKVRAYILVNNKKEFGAWSKVKKVKVK